MAPSVAPSGLSYTDPVTTAALELTQVRKRFGATVALDGLDLIANAGQITGLLGPNGAGKTTAIEIAAGLRPADAGTVRVLGRDPWRTSAAARADVGIMLQRGGVWSGAGAAQAIAHVARFYADPLDPGELMERLHLSGLGRTAFRRMSGGEQQRVKLACAMVGRPRLLVLDEPSSGLDPGTRRELWQLIRDLRDAGTSIVLCTHSMAEAEALADRLAIIDHGRCVASGTTADLTSDPDGQTLRFRAAAHLDRAGLLRALPGGFTLTEDSPGAYLLAGPDIGPRTMAAVTAWCAEHGVLASELSVHHRNLEQVFLDVTGGSEPTR